MRIFPYAAIICLIFLLAGCQGNFSANLPGYIGTSAEVIKKTTEAARPISDNEEYYLGRAVAARILSAYPLVKTDYASIGEIKNAELTEYVNLIGKTVALNSDKPNTFGGYHFAIIDSAEPNAFSCPGGIIFITKGIIKLTRNEDELAAILAHEVAHVNHRDGINAIKSSRWTSVVTTIGTTAAKEYGSKQLGELVTLFEGSVDDVFKTLVVNGYGREQELAADASALNYLARSGYRVQALEDFLKRLNETAGHSTGGVLKTHPGTAERIKNVQSAHKHTANQSSNFYNERQDRFNTVVGSL